MIRPITILTFLMACGSGLYLYQAKHQVQVLDHQIEKTVSDTTKLRQQTRLLATEWTMLNDPQRLQKFANEYLHLQSIAPTQFTDLAGLDSRLPPPEPDQPPAPPPAAVAGPVVASAAGTDATPPAAGDVGTQVAQAPAADASSDKTGAADGGVAVADAGVTGADQGSSLPLPPPLVAAPPVVAAPVVAVADRTPVAHVPTDHVVVDHIAADRVANAGRTDYGSSHAKTRTPVTLAEARPFAVRDNGGSPAHAGVSYTPRPAYRSAPTAGSTNGVARAADPQTNAGRGRQVAAATAYPHPAYTRAAYSSVAPSYQRPLPRHDARYVPPPAPRYAPPAYPRYAAQPVRRYVPPAYPRPQPMRAPVTGSLLGMARGTLPEAPRPTPVSATYNDN